ncbi:NUDIX hydrolase [Desertivibrio insolitus]|uniref:NUDIX hydrolase n=1 Tax=Herbiconiux sp. SYSU D00978 TaxID=2812562 RepID=UPI0027DB66A6|nr:NUDIX hydrolase [Herbiconiux sp. SYSU D00978]
MPTGPRDPGDAWVELPDGRRFWGRFGAAGLLLVDPDDRVLLQHRAVWSHFGGTWGLPGGARHEGEDAVTAAVRESAEEAGIPEHDVRVVAASVLDLEAWSYTTVLARSATHFDAEATDAESIELGWVPRAEVTGYPLHPGLAASWERLAPVFDAVPTVVVDAANVVGSRPDGWWRDRTGANSRLVERLAALAAAGLPGAELGLDVDRVWPAFEVVVEGQARGIRAPHLPVRFGALTVVDAPHDGDSTIAERAATLARPLVVTADRGLIERVPDAAVRGPSWLLGLLDAV